MLVVTFRVAASAYAIRCRNIVEVIPLVALREIAHAKPWLKGLFVYRGELTPVVDLCRLIGGYPCPERLSSRIVLVRAKLDEGGERTLGLLAEHMTEARPLQAQPVAGPPLAPVPYFAEVMLEAGEPLQFLNIDAILPSSSLALAEPGAPPRITAGEENREPSQP